jgi:rRNA pseudouridine-1189 N-methylase Emg1 (Nep1/Mra1 family)
LIDGNIKVNGKQLISQFEGNLQDLMNKFKNSEIILFSSRGKLVDNYKDLFSETLSKNIIAIIGGFQKNTFSEELLRLSNKIVSISEYSLDAWIVTNKIITYYELNHNVQ